MEAYAQSPKPKAIADMTHEELFEEAVKRPGVKAAYDALQDEFAFFRECVKARKRVGLTQRQVAERMGSSETAIARMKSAGNGKKPSPSIRTLQRYAAALGCRLVLKLEPLDEDAPLGEGNNA